MIGDILPGILAQCGLDRLSPDIGDNGFEMRQIRALMNAAPESELWQAQVQAGA